MPLTRRELLQSGAAGLAVLSLPFPALGADANRILVVIQLAGGAGHHHLQPPAGGMVHRFIEPGGEAQRERPAANATLEGDRRRHALVW